MGRYRGQGLCGRGQSLFGKGREDPGLTLDAMRSRGADLGWLGQRGGGGIQVGFI